MRWILQEAAQTAKQRPLLATTYAQLARRRGKQIATVAIARRLLARCFHILNQLEVATTGEGQIAGCARNQPHAPATRPPVLTAQPGPGPNRHADPRSGPEWVRASQLRDRVRAFSPPDPASVRGHRHYEKPPRSQSRAWLPLTS